MITLLASETFQMIYITPCPHNHFESRYHFITCCTESCITKQSVKQRRKTLIKHYKINNTHFEFPHCMYIQPIHTHSKKMGISRRQEVKTFSSIFFFFAFPVTLSTHTQNLSLTLNNLFYKALNFLLYRAQTQLHLIYNHSIRISGSLHAITYPMLLTDIYLEFVYHIRRIIDVVNLTGYWWPLQAPILQDPLSFLSEKNHLKKIAFKRVYIKATVNEDVRLIGFMEIFLAHFMMLQ